MRIIRGIGIMLLAGFLINGCENSGKESATANKLPLNSPGKTTTREFKYFNNMYPLPEGTPIWEAQLNKLNDDDRFENSGLQLSGYTYLRDIKTKHHLEALKDTLLNDFRYIPTYDENSGRFMIRDTKKSKESIRLFLDGIMPTSKEQKATVAVSKDGSPISDAVYLFKEDDAGLVELKWDYRREKLNTLCIVSKSQGIIHDNLLYFISFAPKSIRDVKKEAYSQSQSYPFKSSVIHLGTPIYFSANYKNENYNPYGIRIWYYNIQITASGYKTLEDHKSIVDRSMVAESSSSWGFNDFANLRTKSFVPGEGGHWEFEWAYGYGLNPVSWQGSDSPASGAETKASGRIYLRANELMPLEQE